MGKTSIEWTDLSWPVVNGCRRTSPGCQRCYAEQLASTRLRHTPKYKGLAIYGKNGPQWTGESRLWVPELTMPLSLRAPSMIFVADMGDLFFERVPVEEIAAVFGVMSAAPRHVYQVLTKRAARMREVLADPSFPARVDLMRHVATAGRIQEVFAQERSAPIDGWPGYFVTSKGRVLSTHDKHGGSLPEPHEVAPIRDGAHCHARVYLYGPDRKERKLVHRLVLSAFDRPAVSEDEQGCHIDGDPANNALWNLRWGSQSSNWDDSKRHGTRRRHHKLQPEQVNEIRRLAAAGELAEHLGPKFGVSGTQIRNILTGKQWTPEYKPTWPLPCVWLGVSAESQEYADERIPDLLQTPAAVRFVSYEPALGPIDFSRWLPTLADAAAGRDSLDWVIFGTESGRRARPGEPAWGRAAADQCMAAGVAFFTKQIATASGRAAGVPKGGDPAHWPAGTWPREFPKVAA